MRFEIINNLNRFIEIKDQFDKLISGNINDHIYMKHDYLRLFFECYGIDEQLEIVCGWQENQLAAVAILMNSRIKRKGISFDAMVSVSAGLIPRTSIIAKDDSALLVLIDHITSNCEKDIIELRDFEDANPTTMKILDHIQSLKKTEFVQLNSKNSPYIDTNDSWEKYLQAQSRNRRRFLKNRLDKKLAECEHYSVERIVDPVRSDEILDKMLRISESSWKAEQGTSISQVQKQKIFYEKFTPLGLKNGWIHIWLLQINNEPAAFEYYLIHKGSYCGIRSDYDKRFADFYPGDVIKRAILQFLFKHEEFNEYDMGGTVTSYKLRWTSTIRKHSNILIAGKSMKGSALVFAMKHIRPIIKKLMPDKQEVN